MSWGNRPLLIGPAAESRHCLSGRGREVKRGDGCRRLLHLHCGEEKKRKKKRKGPPGIAFSALNLSTPATALLSRRSGVRSWGHERNKRQAVLDTER